MIKLKEKSVEKNYFLSGWIANLGVVPLLLFALFLLFPAFFFLFALLISVIAVFDIIFNLQNHRASIKILFVKRNIYLTALLLSVKVFHPLSAKQTKDNRKDSITTYKYTISTGEILNITHGKMNKFSVSNKDVIRVKPISSSKKLLIKGLKQGRSNLLIWGNNNKQFKYEFFVINKRLQLKLIEIKEILKELNIDSKINAELVLTTGEIKTIETYKILHKLKKNNNDKIFFFSSLSKKLRNNIIAHIYQDLIKENIETFSCDEEFSVITCRVSVESFKKNQIIEYYQKNLHIKFIKINDLKQIENYQLVLDLIEVHQGNDKNKLIGIDSIESNLEMIKNLVRDRLNSEVKLSLNDQDTSLKLLSNQKISLIPGKAAHLRVGGEIKIGEIVNSETNSKSPIWRFVGLESKFEINSTGSKNIIDYNINFSSPSQSDSNEINESKKKSQVLLKLGQTVKIFEATFNLTSKQKKGVYGLNKIPLIGEIFQGTQKNNIYKKVIGVITITKEKINE